MAEHAVVPGDQRETLDFLSSPAAYGLATGSVDRIDTHISVVFLAGRRAYKLKKALRFPYLDYSTLPLREQACRREVTLNRRTAPQIYRGVLAVTRAPDGHLTLGAGGAPVEWLVEMTRFEQDQLFDRMASTGRLDLWLMPALATAVALFHKGAEPRRDTGGARSVEEVINGNHAELLRDGVGVIEPSRCERLHAASLSALAAHADLLDARRMHGLVRQCHGDLHLRNVCLIDGQPVMFDAIEFNDGLSAIDVLYDLAFLLMDLLHRGTATHANAVLNGYLEIRADFAGLALLPLFLSCRAAIRAKVSLAAATVQPNSATALQLRGDAVGYLDLAERVLARAAPQVLAIGGWSGSGKSSLARGVAPALGAAPGAIVLRSDVVRKRLLGVDPLERLPDAAYAPDVTARVYGRLAQDAQTTARAGHSVVVDAVFDDPLQRALVERATLDTGAAFHGVWLEVPAAVAFERLATRTHDVSDATPDVLRMQFTRDPGEMSWQRLDAVQPRDILQQRVRDIVAPPVAADGGS